MPVTTTYPDGETLAIEYDKQGKPLTMANTNAFTYVHDVLYDEAGRMTGLGLGVSTSLTTSLFIAGTTTAAWSTTAMAWLFTANSPQVTVSSGKVPNPHGKLGRPYLNAPEGSKGLYQSPYGYPSDPSTPPANDFEWRGVGQPGTNQGNWVNPKTGEWLHWDPYHHGIPHYDYSDPSRNLFRIWADGSMSPK